MPKTKSQAEKREERQLKQKEKEAERLHQKELREQQFRKQYQAPKVAPDSDDGEEQSSERKSPDISGDELQQDEEEQYSRYSSDPEATIEEDEAPDGAVETPVIVANSAGEKGLVDAAAAAALPAPPQLLAEPSYTQSAQRFFETTPSASSSSGMPKVVLHNLAALVVPVASHVRIVNNHSTYCGGLRPVLTRLEKTLPDCTVIPGPLSKGKTHENEFSLRIQRAQEFNNTYKLVARKGYTSQDLIITFDGDAPISEEVLVKLIQGAIQPKHSHRKDQSSVVTTCVSAQNRQEFTERERVAREQNHDKYVQAREKEQQAQLSEEVAKQRRTLATKPIDPRQIDSLASRDVAIIKGEDRGKYSMMSGQAH